MTSQIHSIKCQLEGFSIVKTVLLFFSGCFFFFFWISKMIDESIIRLFDFEMIENFCEIRSIIFFD